MRMAATDFEFRHRMSLIAALFALAFALSWGNAAGAGQTLARWLSAMGAPGSTAASRHAAFAFAAALVAAGAALRTWGTAYLDVDTMRGGRLRSDRLVVAGPYRHVRNPLYLGNLLVVAGMGLLAGRAGFVVLVAGMIVFLYRLILREEQHLLAAHGDAFRRFRAVPRLWPALAARAPVSDPGTRAHWVPALAAEGLMWAGAAAMTVYAATLSLTAFGVVLSVGAIATGGHYALRFPHRPRK
jgi:protein-S-isoprenylcysteine O-methyltransferase Ste14